MLFQNFHVLLNKLLFKMYFFPEFVKSVLLSYFDNRLYRTSTLIIADNSHLKRIIFLFVEFPQNKRESHYSLTLCVCVWLQGFAGCCSYILCVGYKSIVFLYISRPFQFQRLIKHEFCCVDSVWTSNRRLEEKKRCTPQRLL